MAYVNVVIIAPDGNEYEADIDENSDEEELLEQLKAEIGLSDDSEYEIYFNTRGIRQGTKIRITRKTPKLIQRFRKR